MITIKQVAKLAGVSTTTASYALNNRPEVKAETARKVLKAAEKLNYVPNRVAQNFRNGKTNTITVITSESIECGNTFTAEFFGILSGAREKQYDVLVKLMDTDLKKSAYQLDLLMGNKLCDGYLLLGNLLDHAVAHIVSNGLSGVLLSSHTDQPILQVNVDGRKWIAEITKLAFESGRTKPVYFTFELLTEEEKLRKSGFVDAISRRAVHEQDKIFCCGYQGELLYHAVEQCIKNQVDTIICWNDILAAQVINCLQGFQKNVPGDIAVTGFDDAVSQLNIKWELTTVAQPFFEKGRIAVSKLIELIEMEDCDKSNILLDCSIIRRSSL